MEGSNTLTIICTFELLTIGYEWHLTGDLVLMAALPVIHDHRLPC